MIWALAAVVVIGWLWFLAAGRARGEVKRLALRATIVAIAGGLIANAARRGLFLRATVGFQIAILGALLSVVLGYLYLVRFCPACGRMVRDLKVSRCPRCDAELPAHGMTSRPRRAPPARRPSRR